MAENSFKTRIIHKHDIESNWALAVNFIPKAGELIVYDVDDSHSSPRFKIGNGRDVVTSLPFASGGAVDIGNATVLKSGLMSAADKIKLNNIEENATSVYVDSTLKSNSSNAIQNKAVYNALEEKADAEHTHDSSEINGLASVATSGSYTELLDRPPIVTLLSQLVNDVGYITNADIDRVMNLSEYNNDAGFITTAVNNLTNYYNKANSYSKTEINNMLNGLSTFEIRIVDELPETGESNCFYLIKNKDNENSNYYDEYLWIGENFELIGNTKVDLSDYLTKVGNSSDTIVEFETAAERVLPTSGQKLSGLFGRIVKFLTDLKTVAFSGSYNDLSDIPDVALKEDLTELVSNKDLHSVAFSGDYADLENLPDVALKNDLVGIAFKSDLDNVAFKDDLNGFVLDSSLSAVAKSGNYTDLENLPDVALKSELEGLVSATDLNNIAFSGSYNDLTDAPDVVLKGTLKEVAFSGDFNDLSNTEELATKSEVNSKQDILSGIEGQVVQFDNEGKPVAATLELISVNDIDTICGVNN